ncbi:M48 family metallopeptidase [Acetonema longum]|uniref:YgjP-like metallopeptidase domain-containing protein n=1 Tax=Acetonema longum DSM 6540 TaxID=1009370 RepID=F7NQ78_9FIRM|nr:SprT family zinc-dependent metalloprotease [Acetonema longum]EGO61837.1 hypothetical protein ALO_21394 [Acetonema longum DSM 6540]
MPSKTINGHAIDYTVIISTRRTSSARLKITSSTTLEITIPSNYDAKKIDHLLIQKSAWISRTTERLKGCEAAAGQLIQPGMELPLHGQMHQVVLHESTHHPGITLADNQRILLRHQPGQTGQDVLKKILVIWYRRMAYQTLREKTEYWGGIIGARPNKITIRDPKTRWGSCSARAAISYSWRIIMAPECVIDYLVVHELCHLRIPNHSTQYWAFLARYIPDYEEQRRWLKQNGHLIMSLLGK